MTSFFKIVSFLEGASYILLLLIAVPVKYIGENEFWVKILGMPHGILFILYIIIACIIKKDQQWPNKEFLIILIASLIPFGTFYVNTKYLKK
tara:strand:- start:133 stop:408 length:276 start_codon:yes stop_codon:yes gene_type:complete